MAIKYYVHTYYVILIRLTQIERVVEGGEPAVFKQYFKTWKEVESSVGLGRVFTKRQIAGENT